MSKYSLRKRLLMENEEDIVTADVENAVVPAETQDSVFNINDFAEFITAKGNPPNIDFGDYVPEIKQGKGLHGEDVYTIKGPSPDNPIKLGNNNMKAVDFCEVLCAYILSTNNSNQKAYISGPTKDFDVSLGENSAVKWEVKSMVSSTSPVSARLGKAGKFITGKSFFSFIEVAYSGTKEILDVLELYDNKLDEKLRNLKQEATKVLDSFKDKRGNYTRQFTLEIGDTVMGNLLPPLAKMNEILSGLECEVSDMVITIGDRNIDISGFSPKHRANIFRSVEEYVSTFIGDDIQTTCEVLAVTPEIFLEEPAKFKEFIGQTTIIGAQRFEDSDETEIYAKVAEEYISEAGDGLQGFVFVYDAGSSEDISSGRIRFHWLTKEIAIKAAREGDLKFPTMTQGSVKILFDVNGNGKFDVAEDGEDGNDPEQEKVLAQAKATATAMESVGRRRMNTLFEWALSGKRYKQ